MRGLGGGGKRARRSAAETEALLQLLPGAEERRTEWAGDLMGDGQLVHCSLSTRFFYKGGGRW